jgi:hypothetical protein
LFSVLYSFWGANYAVFNGDVLRELAAQFLALAEKQRATVPLMIGHRLMGTSLLCTGDMVESRAHYTQALALYDPVEHRLLAARFGQDVGVAILSYRSLALWMLGYPEAALADAEQAVKDARDNGQAATLMYALLHASWTHILNGTYAAANALLAGLVALADQKGASFWKAYEMCFRGLLFSLSRKNSEAIHLIASGIDATRTVHATLAHPWLLSTLAKAHAELGQFDDAWRCSDEAMTAAGKTNDKWFETELNRVAGEIALKSPEPDRAKAEAYFERALAIARA